MNPWTNYANAAVAAGCPRDQVEKLLKSGVILSPKQLEASAAARACDKTGGPLEIGVGGARGGGKSMWLLWQMGADDAQRLPGYKGLFLRKVGKSATESIIDLSRVALRHVPHTVNMRGVVEFPNGSKIITGHFKTEKDIDAYLGLEYDCIGIEEYTTLTKTKTEAIGTCCRSSKPGWRPRQYNSTNPGGIGHAHYKRKFVVPYRQRTERDTRFVPFTVDDNPFVNVEYRDVLDKLSGWMKRAWRFGDWDIAAGQFFDTFAEAHHVVRFNTPYQISKEDKAREIVPTDWFAALDYGFTHYTVFLLGCRDGDGNHYIVAEHAQRKWQVSMHAKSMHALLARFGLTTDNLRFCVAGPDVFSRDQKGRTIADDYKDVGVRLTSAMSERKPGWARIIGLLGDPSNTDHAKRVPAKLFIHPRCRLLVETLPQCLHDDRDPEDVLKVDTDDTGEGGDDAPDTLRYLVATKLHEQRVVRVRGL